MKTLLTSLSLLSLQGFATAAEVLFVDNETPDSSWQNLIESDGHTYTLFDTATYNLNLNDQSSIDYVEGFDVIIVSGSNPNFNAVRTHGANWNTLTTPMVNLGNYLISGQFSSGSWSWVSSGTGRSPNSSGGVDVIEPDNPVLNEVTTEPGPPVTTTLYTQNAGHFTLDGNEFLPGISTIAVQTSDTTRISVAYAPPGALRPESQEQYFIASFTGGQGNPVPFDANGEILFLNAIAALTGGVVVSSPLEQILIFPNAVTSGNYDFRWASQDGKVYDLVSSTDLNTAPGTWPVWQEQSGLAATPPLNDLPDIPGGGNGKRFFAVIEKDSN